MNKFDTTIKEMQLTVSKHEQVKSTADRERERVMDMIITMFHLFRDNSRTWKNNTESLFTNWCDRKIFLDPDDPKNPKLFMYGRGKVSGDDQVVSAKADGRVRKADRFKRVEFAIKKAQRLGIDINTCLTWQFLDAEIKRVQYESLSQPEKAMLEVFAQLRKDVKNTTSDFQKVTSALKRARKTMRTTEVGTEVKTRRNKKVA